MSTDERLILKTLETAVRSPGAAAFIRALADRLDRALAQGSASPMAWDTVPLELYGDSLPPLIRSSWVFILRAGTSSGAQRHPNSHQRTISYRGSGDLQLWAEGRWRSHPLLSEPSGAIEDCCVSIPPNTWHQAVVPAEHWIVVSFHTAGAQELIEETGDPGTESVTRQRRYR
jgi:hypothetical protein